MFKKSALTILMSFLSFLFFASTVFTQGMTPPDGPSFVFVFEEVLISGQDYQANFGGGVEGGEISFVSELPIQVEDPDCQKNDFQIICPGGDGYTATVTADYVGGDIYTGFILYKSSPEGHEKLASYVVPMVPDGRVVPYRVKVKSLTTSGARVEISIINTSEEVFQDQIDMKVFEPENQSSERSFGALVKPGESVVYTTDIPMSGYGYHTLTFQVGESELYFPLGGDILYPYKADLEMYIPKLGK